MTTNHPHVSSASSGYWLMASWQTDRRYYQIDISQDLFGMWLFKRCWGGLGSNRGNSKTCSFTDYEDALKSFEDVARRRLRRGYVRIA